MSQKWQSKAEFACAVIVIFPAPDAAVVAVAQKADQADSADRMPGNPGCTGHFSGGFALQTESGKAQKKPPQIIL